MKSTTPNTTFRDSTGDEWNLRISIGRAMALREQLGIDIQDLVTGSMIDDLLAIDNGWKLIEILAFLLTDQIEQKGISDHDFLDRLDGEVLDAALIAFLWAVSESLPKLKRRPIQTVIRRMDPAIDRATAKLETRIQATDLDTEIDSAISKSLGSSPELPE